MLIVCQVNCSLILLSILFLSSIGFVRGAYVFGWMLHNPIPDESLVPQSAKHRISSNDSVLSDEAPEKLQNGTVADSHKIRCSEDVDCKMFGRKMYCDSHYGFCDELRREFELCRTDEQCESGLICIFGKCENPAKPGHKGARCDSDSDCKPHLCCARQHGEKVCKAKLQKGQRCFVPVGGLDYSLNELCPCDHGLVCTKKRRRKNRRNLNNLKCDTIKL